MDNEKNFTCPKCGNKGNKVKIITPQNLLKEFGPRSQRRPNARTLIHPFESIFVCMMKNVGEAVNF